MNILGKPSATLEQCKVWIKGVKSAHPMASAMVPLLWDAALANGIDPAVLVAQAMKETGYFNFKGVIRPNFCNTCGLKVTKGGGDQDPGAHMRFEYWEDGIMAHSDHLALYAGASNQPKYSPECASHTNENYKDNGTTKDPRHFTYLHGKCKSVEELSGNWAPGADYGQEVARIANQIINTKVEEHVCSGDDGKYKELYEKTKSDLDSVMQSFNELKSAYYNKEKELEEKTNEFNITDKLLANAREAINSLTAQLEEKTNDFNITDDLLTNAREAIESLNNQLETIKNDLFISEESVKTLKEYKNKLETDLDCAQLQNDRLEATIVECNKQINELNVRVEELENANKERPKSIISALIDLFKSIIK